MAELNPRQFTAWRNAVQVCVSATCVYPFYLMLKRISIEGRENMTKGEAYIVVGNHVSYYDPPILYLAANVKMAFLAKEQLFNNVPLGHLLGWLGAIPLNREKPEPSTFKSIRKILRDGWSLAMFIEGTRSKIPGQLGRPQLGAAYLAKMNKVRILPVGIRGTGKRFDRAVIKIGKPIEAGSDLEATTWEVMESLSQLTGYSMPERLIAEKTN